MPAAKASRSRLAFAAGTGCLVVMVMARVPGIPHDGACMVSAAQDRGAAGGLPGSCGPDPAGSVPRWPFSRLPRPALIAPQHGTTAARASSVMAALRWRRCVTSPPPARTCPAVAGPQTPTSCLPPSGTRSRLLVRAAEHCDRSVGHDRRLRPPVRVPQNHPQRDPAPGREAQRCQRHVKPEPEHLFPPMSRR